MSENDSGFTISTMQSEFYFEIMCKIPIDLTMDIFIICEIVKIVDLIVCLRSFVRA